MSGPQQAMLFAEGAAASDPLWASVVLLLHCDGSNGSTTFTDSSSYGRTMTANGNAQLSTANAKYGSAAGLLDGTGDYVSCSSSAELAPGTGDFCFEIWAKRIGATPSGQSLFTFGSQNWNVYADITSNFIKFWDGTADRITGSATFAGTYRHIALDRNGTSVRLWADGTQIGSTYTSSTNIGAAGVRIGYYVSGGSYLNGAWDEARLTMASRYSSSFTPPPSAFPNG